MCLRGHRAGERERSRPNRLFGWLLDRHRIQTVAIAHPEFSGLRITPNGFTTIDEVDRFADTMLAAIRNGLPAA